jgi:hypothetical protein
MSILPTVGDIRWRALRGQIPLSDSDKKKYLEIPFNFLSVLL